MENVVHHYRTDQRTHVNESSTATEHMGESIEE